MNKTLLRSALLLMLLSITGNIFAQEKGQFSIFANFGGGTLEDKDASIILTSDGTAIDVDTLKVGVLKLGLGANYAHPISAMFSIGAMLELRLLFNNSEYKTASNPTIGTIGANLSSVGLGLALGPYFRLGLWGANKKGGIGFAPYFLLNSLRPTATNKLTRGGRDIEWADDAVLGLGGGLMVDIYFIKNFGLNLGFELQGGGFDTNSTPDSDSSFSGSGSVFGPVFYGGIILSF